METLMDVMKYLWGPIVGAVIGYCTNYIAVKMLFHPHKPWKIGKFRVPFTPGIVPQRQGALAKAIGDAVGNYLFTGDDLKTLFLTEQTKERAVDMAMDALDLSLVFKASDKPLPTANELGLTYFKEEQWETAKQSLTNFLTDRISDSVDQMDLGRIIAEQAAAVAVEKKSALGLLSMFINEYIKANGRDMIANAVKTQINGYSERPLHDLMVYTSEEQIRDLIGAIYEKLMSGIGERFKDMLDISSAVEKKVAEMSVRDMEALCMKVMKRELNTIVNLGALIGFVLGVFNILM